MKTSTAEIGAAGYFSSGLQSPGEIRGTALGGYAVGVSCAKVQKGMIDALIEVARFSITRVFVDSGAFAEVRFDKVAGRLVDKRPLTDADWQKRFAVYERCAANIAGRSLYLVAPDKVGDQLETLTRMSRYAPRVHAILQLRDSEAFFGPRLIVPVQRGALNMGAFADQCLEALGLGAGDDRLVYGIPSSKGATSLDELRAFAGTRAPGSAFHLLGMGPKSPRFEKAIDAVLEACPGAIITCDAVRIAALSVRVGKPRALIVACDALRAANPGITPTEVKFRSTLEVFGRESVALLHDNGWRDPELHDEDGTCYVGGNACPCTKKAPGFEVSRGGQYAAAALP